MTKQTEAMKAALTAMKSIDEAMPFPVAKFAIRQLEEALAEQPAQPQEPVAYMNPDDLEKMKRFGRGSVAWATPTDFCTQPVYTSPQPSKPWVGLTHDEWQAIDDAHDWRTTLGRVQSCEAIEAKLREKNT